MNAPRSRSGDSGFARAFKSSILFLIVFSLFILTLLLTATNAYSQVTATWTASPSSNVTGYKIYYGTASGSYPFSVDAGNTTRYTFTGLSTGTTYYFAAKAYDSSGDLSAYSNEASYAIPSTCTYSISPTGQSFTASGGTGSVSVTTQSGCAWTAASAASWMTITSGGSGSGSGTVGYSVAANTTTSSLNATSTIAGRSFTVTEAGVQTFTITASAGTGGTISPSGSVSVNSGSNQTFTIAATGGYAISNVTEDGVSVGAFSSYTFDSVAANHTIAASFTATPSNTYSLTLTKTGTGTGSVTTSPNGTSFASGTPVTLTAAAGTNSTFTGWSGACSGSSQTCQVTMNSNIGVGAAFSSTSSSDPPGTSGQDPPAGAATAAASTGGGGGAGGGGCFIATAAFGSYLDPHVAVLRLFRDSFLLTNRFGKAFVSWYYATSPSYADAIRHNEPLKGIVRLALFPLIGFAYLCLAIGAVPALLMAVVFLGALAWGARRLWVGSVAVQRLS